MPWAAHLGAASLVLVIGYAATHFGVFGGGDAKLWAAVALWTGFDSLASHSLLTALFGGVLAIGLLVLRRGVQMMIAGAGAVARAREIPKVLRPGAPVPYGLAICAAALVVFLRSPPAFLIGN